MKRMKTFLAAFLSFALAMPTTFAGVVAAEEAKTYAPGVTVEANQTGKSDADYQVTFVYESDKEIDSVTVAGNFQWHVESEKGQYVAMGDNSAMTQVRAEDYKDGMYNSSGLNGQEAYELEETSEGHYEVTIPVPGNLYFYDYTITYADGSNETIKDPANMPKANPATSKDSGHSLVYVGNGSNCTAGQEYIYPRTDGKVGKRVYIPYVAVDGTTQYVEVYTPYGYDTNKVYPTVYVSHGGGGNEAEWMEIGAAGNIMDNLIASGEMAPVVMVTMDNQIFGWDAEKTIPNVLENIIPMIESKFAVSKDAEDRAFCGLSMGSMMTNTMAKQHPEAFGYFGAFSGGIQGIDDNYKVEAMNDSVLYLTAGCIDMAYNNKMGIASVDLLAKYDELGINYTFDLLLGAHDWGVWRESLTKFAKDYLWDVDTSSDKEAGVTVEGNKVTFVYEDTNKQIDKVELVGNFQWYRWDDPAIAEFAKNGSAPEAKVYSAYDYVDGEMFNANYGINSDSIAYPFVKTATGRYELELTLPGSEYAYKYQITYKDGSSVSIQDPANPSPKNEATGHDSGNSLVWVGSKDNCIQGQEYIYARDDQNGSFEFIPYKAVDGTTQYLGVYTPYGYDTSKEYKTVYISHGGGGNEAEWPFIGSATNIFDNLIAEGETEAAVYVTMDNTYFGWNYDKIAENFSKHIIPLIEEKYAVSKKVEDRALCGLSMGALTTGTIMFSYTDMFGAYACFSGTADPMLCKDIDLLKSKTIYLTGGNIDMAIQAAPDAEDSAFNRGKTVRAHEYLESIGVEHYYDLKGGAHDWGVWRETLTTFLKDVLWATQAPSDKEAGVTVEGNEVTFVYENTTDKVISSITVGGTMQWYSPEDPAVKDFINKGNAAGAVVYGADQYKEGMFNTGYGLNGDSVQYPLQPTTVENRYETTITLPGSEYAYDYTITYADGSKVTIQDPANPSPKNEANGHDSGHSLVYVGDKDNCIAGQEYIYAREDKNGSFEYIPYTAVDGTTQYLGVYTPYGYDSSKEYKTVYVSHGGGGNEAEWGFIGSMINIMDNMIAEGNVEPTIAVTMDNTYFGWNYEKIAENFAKCIIPTIEAKYSVGTERDDRALCGLSMGAMTTTTLMQANTELFGYYGAFSGANVPVEVKDVEMLKDSVIYLTAGCVDMAWVDAPEKDQSRKTIAMGEKLEELGVEFGYDVKAGAHDWGVWREALSTFVKDYLWNKEAPVTPDQPGTEGGTTGGQTTPTTPTNPTKPNVGIYNNAAYVAVATIALAGAAYVAFKKKED